MDLHATYPKQKRSESDNTETSQLRRCLRAFFPEAESEIQRYISDAEQAKNSEKRGAADGRRRV